MSEDNGWTWESLFEGRCLSVAVDPFDSNHLWVGVLPPRSDGPVLFHSKDRGKTWGEALSRLSDGQGAASIAMDPNIPGLLYVVSGSLYWSADGGLNWKIAVSPQSEPGGTPTSTRIHRPVRVRADPRHPGRFYVQEISSCIGFCPVTSSVSRSDDGGQTFTVIWKGLSPPLDVQVDAGGDLLLAGGTLARVNTTTFEAVELGGFKQAVSVAQYVLDPGSLYVGLEDGSVMVSSDQGLTFDLLASLPGRARLLAVGGGPVVHASQDETGPR